MIITEYTETLRMTGERVVALGFFDGVHLAHRHLLRTAREEARRTGRELCVFTFFSESPQLKPGKERIYPTETKLSLLEAQGVEHVVTADFSLVSHLSAETFVSRVLREALGCATAVCGYNFRFAHGAAADADELRRRMRASGGEAIVCEPVLFRDAPLSATAIRTWLALGDISSVNAALGAPYRLHAVTQHGLGLGRTLGTPTVNLSFPAGVCRPKHGVYRCIATVGERRYAAVTNVGTCPTFGGRPPHAECYLLDFDGDIYGEPITVYFLGYLREERTFSSADELKMQIEIDKNRAKQENPPQMSAELF